MDNKVVLCILDGFGFQMSKFYNPIFEAKFFFELLENNPYCLLNASGSFVGLPEKQVGGSEVGHMTIGSGRIIKQSITLINDSINSGEIEGNAELMAYVDQLRTSGGYAHILGMFSAGGIHSHKSHYIWAIKFMKECGIRVKLHIFLDGRDTTPKDAVETLSVAIANGDISLDDIATVQGRKFAMDRDGDWKKTEKSANAILYAKTAMKTKDVVQTINDMYELGVTDEDMEPFAMDSYEGAAENDAFFMVNFRSDRIVQILTYLSNLNRNILSMMRCSAELDSKIKVIFRMECVKNSLGEVLSKNGLKQLRIAETEKFPHITKFFNGERDVPFELEDRIFVPSKKNDDGVIISPEMSAYEVANKVLMAIDSNKYAFIAVNFANTDVIGHTGDFEMALKTIRVVDGCLAKVYEKCVSSNYNLIVTADHGNIEILMDEKLRPHKAHTFSLVPFVAALNDKTLSIVSKAESLEDVAPTILEIMNLDKPFEMTGTSLLQKR